MTRRRFVFPKSAIENLKRSSAQGRNFVKLHTSSTMVFVISDASVAKASGLKSQLGYVTLMADKKVSVNIVQYGSNRCHHATQTVMAGGVHALVRAVDIGMIVRNFLNELLIRSVDIEAFVES